MAGMMSLLPGATPADINGAFAVIALLSDDNKCKQRYNELMAAVAKADEAIAAANTASVQLQADKAALVKLMGEVEQKQAAAVQREQAAVAAEAAVAAREAEVNHRSQAAHEEIAQLRAASVVEGARQRTEIAQANDKLTADRQAHEAKVKEFDTSSTTASSMLDARAAGIRHQEEVIVLEAAKLAELRRDLEAKMAKLKAIVA